MKLNDDDATLARIRDGIRMVRTSPDPRPGEADAVNDVSWLLGEYDRLTQRVADMGRINGELLRENEMFPRVSASAAATAARREEVIALTAGAMAGFCYPSADANSQVDSAEHAVECAFNALSLIDAEEQGDPNPPEDDDGRPEQS